MAYHCSECGYRSAKWMGFCPRCRRDAALTEAAPRGAAAARPLSQIEPASLGRLTSGVGEVDRVLGGGLVSGAAVLLGGEPGVGKSTLLLQMADGYAAAGHTSLVASAEESASQVALRARRLGVVTDGVYLLAVGDVESLIAAAEDLRPAVVVVDSIQALASSEASGAPGSIAQVRDCAAQLVEYAKSSGVPVILAGHVTKDGGIAGPKLLEHVVDVVLYMEGELDAGMRLLRGLKNRFGATHQVGLFEMGAAGLEEVADPSRAFLGEWRGAVPGTVAFPAVEGRRPLLVEVQALVSARSTPQPRRSVRGLDPARVHQLIAVLERHALLDFSGHDVFVGVVGGIKVREPAADLPVALALGSSLLEAPLGLLASWGEVGLTGEVRPVGHGRRRTAEAARLGISTVVCVPDGEPGRIEVALARAGLIPADGPGGRVVASSFDEPPDFRPTTQPAPLAGAGHTSS